MSCAFALLVGRSSALASVAVASIFLSMIVARSGWFNKVAACFLLLRVVFLLRSLRMFLQM